MRGKNYGLESKACRMQHEKLPYFIRIQYLSSKNNPPQWDMRIISVSVVNVPLSRAHPRTTIDSPVLSRTDTRVTMCNYELKRRLIRLVTFHSMLVSIVLDHVSNRLSNWMRCSFLVFCLFWMILTFHPAQSCRSDSGAPTQYRWSRCPNPASKFERPSSLMCRWLKNDRNLLIVSNPPQVGLLLGS